MAFSFSDVEEFGVVREIGKGVFHLCNDLLGFFDVEMSGEFEKFGFAWVLVGACKRELMTVVRRRRKREVIGWREDPVAGSVHEKTKIFGVVVGVLRI